MIFFGIMAAVMSSQCSSGHGDGWDDTGDDWDDTGGDWEDEPRDLNPTGISVDLPDWPPIGPDTPIHVEVRDEDGVDAVRITFREDVWGSPGSRSAVVTATGSQLGEGLGPLVVEVTDMAGVITWETISPVLVDLTPPTLHVPDVLLAVADPDAAELLEVRMVDGWVLGSLELELDGEHQRVEMPPGYPETTGAVVDATWIDFAVDEVPHGLHDAVLVATDAAGNVHTEALEVLLDGAPPAATFTSPAPDDVLEGWSSVVVDVVDDHDAAPRTTLYLGATDLGTFVGGDVVVQVDVAGFAPGPYELVAVTEDEAGNVHEAAVVPVWVAPAPMP